MKKLVLAAFALTAAASVFAQGTVNFVNRTSIAASAGTSTTTHIYAPLGTDDYTPVIGRGATDGPVGTTDFGARALIGANGAAAGVKYGGAATFAQLIGGTGSMIAESSLQPVGAINTFRTGSSAGILATSTDSLTANPGYTFSVPSDGSGVFTFEIVAWDNSSGLYPTWNAVTQKAWTDGLIAAGHSAEFIMTSVGGASPASYLSQNGPLTSFNLYFQPVPEPTTLALAGLGAAALLIFRRRK